MFTPHVHQMLISSVVIDANRDDVIKWKHFLRYWPFVRGIHRFPVNSPHQGQWRGALIFSSICVWINGWIKNREAGDLRRYRAHYDATAMDMLFIMGWLSSSILYGVSIYSPTSVSKYQRKTSKEELSILEFLVWFHGMIQTDSFPCNIVTYSNHNKASET